MSKGIRLSAGEVMGLANDACGWFKDCCDKNLVTGSLRRGLSDVGDIDLAVAVRDDQYVEFNARLGELFGFQKSNPSKANRSGEFGGVKMQITDVKPDSFGAAVLMTTGCSKLNIAMRILAKMKGWKLNRYGLWLRDEPTERVGSAFRESDLFKSLGLVFVEPCNRSVGGPWESVLEIAKTHAT